MIPETSTPVPVRSWLRDAGDARFQFVVINLAVNLLFLVRGYIFLLVLDYRELGQVTLLQSIVLFLGILQFGVLSGGYRLMLSAGDDERQSVVNFVYSYIVALGAIAMILAGIAMTLVTRTEDGFIGVLGAAGGTATLIRSWQTQQMIATERLGLLNAINLGSTLASLLCFGFLPLSPIYACIAVIVVQPMLFAVLAWITGGAAPLERLNFAYGLARRIVTAGFLLFLTSMLLQLNIQLERWYVTAEIGIDALGHLFIAIMVVTLLQLVPAALDAIFLPAAVRAHGEKDDAALRRTLRGYLFLLLAYAAAAVIGIAFVAEPFLALLAPQYLQDLIYVYLIAPGALLLAVSSAFGMIYTVLIRYRLLLISYGVGTILLTIVLGLAVIRGVPLSLEGVVAWRSFALGITATLVVAGWWHLSRSHPEFLLWGRISGKGAGQ